MKTCSLAQGKINEKLDEIFNQARQLSSEHPLVFNSIAGYSGTANSLGKHSLEEIKAKRFPQAEKSEEKVVQYLEALVKDSERQKKQIKQMAKNNFNSLRPSGRRNMFVFIPKEAIYTVPIKYKDRIIDMSKKRGKSSKEKEAFWRDVLE